MARFRGVLTGLALAAGTLIAVVAVADQDVERTPAPEGARVYLIAPEDGATVSSPVRVQFGLAEMGVAPAGVVNPKTGHHHLVIDAPTPAADAPIPSDDRHRHFGGGQTDRLREDHHHRRVMALEDGDDLELD